jgi:predicted phosphoribosyltransferase
MQYFQKIFQNHSEAGEYLAKKLLPFKHSKPIILSLPQEGVPVAARVAQLLEAPFDVVVSRTLHMHLKTRKSLLVLLQQEMWL